MNRALGLPALIVFVLFCIPGAYAQVVLVEPAHTLNQIVDSAFPLDPSQFLLDAIGVGDIESIGIDPVLGDLYVQLSSGGFLSATTDIFKVTPAGVVTPVVLGTGFGINSRGTDLHFDPITGLLVTQDQNFGLGFGRIATVTTPGGVIGTWTAVPPFLFFGATFGMDFSAGVGPSDVPAGEVVFTSDLQGNGMHSAPLGGPVITHLPLPPGGGDDMVIQPDGDWVHVGDFTFPLTAYNPVGPDPHATLVSPLDIGTIFANDGLPFVFGSRATVCDTTGELYISYSGGKGGSGIFRVDEPLLSATLVATIGPVGEGLQDLTFGPASSGSGTSVYFTVHDFATAGEEVWEITAPCGTVDIDLKPGSNPNCVNPRGGVTSVAILTTPTFDATQVDPDMVEFGGADALRCAIEDAGADEGLGDGDLDLVCKFRKRDVIWPGAGSDCGTVALTAETIGGQLVEGVAIVCLAGEPACNAGTPQPIP